jgi:hypothetical protein
LTAEIVNVNLEKALEGDLKRILLNKRSVVFTRYWTFVENIKRLTVKSRCIYYYEGLTLTDLFGQAGGLTVPPQKGWKWPE